MRELLHAGERLGVGVSATAALRSRIRRREWEDSARKALSAKTSVNALAGEPGGGGGGGGGTFFITLSVSFLVAGWGREEEEGKLSVRCMMWALCEMCYSGM